MTELYEKLKAISGRKGLPAEGPYRKVISAVKAALLKDSERIRPRDAHGFPGGLVLLKPDTPVILIPDLHGRHQFFLNVMEYAVSGKLSTAEALRKGKVQVVCLGDGFHGEARAASRWYEALREYRQGWATHRHMDEEMSENFALMEMVMETKIACPDTFHFIKGNHENIGNEDGYGNYSFGKFVNEGEMVASFVDAFYSAAFMEDYYDFEKLLPLFVVGQNFIASHAEPARFFGRDEIIGFRDKPEVVYGLTWTDNGKAERGSVERMLKAYLAGRYKEQGYYFGGHRPVSGKYALRAGGKYVQIHNPSGRIIAHIDQTGPIDLERAVIDLEDTD